MADVQEVGSSGLRRTGGFVLEEFLSQLKHPKAQKVYREMSDNDPIIGAYIYGMEKVITRLKWAVAAGSETPQAEANRVFIEECLYDMSDNLTESVSSILSMIKFGFSWHEVVYKIRGGESQDPTRKSKFNDGKIGWRKWAVRAQETLYQWQFDEDGGIQAYVQMDPSTGEIYTIPIDKSLLFRTSSHKNNPEGRSLLRNAYRPWFFKKKIEEIEAIGIERDLAGLPVAKVPSKLLAANATAEDKAALAGIMQMVTNVKRNQSEGIVMPSDRDENSNLLYELTLLSTGGSRVFDTDAIIARYNQQIAMSVLADFLLLGHENVGTYSLGVSKLDLWIMSVDAIAKQIAEVINTHAIPKLLALNGMDTADAPFLTYSDVAAVDLAALGTFIFDAMKVGAIMPDASLEAFLRDIAKLPQMDDPNRDYLLPNFTTVKGGEDTGSAEE